MLEEMLLERFGLEKCPEFSYSDRGKPFLRERPDIFFNLSHCARGIACAVSDSPVGIDIEEIQYDESLASAVLNGRELAEVLSSDEPGVKFTQLWTRKESFLKLSGLGLPDNLKDVPGDASGVRFETTVNRVSGYVCTVASRQFTYPFRYTPDPQIVRAAREMTARIDSSPELNRLFSEGKMLGVLMVQGRDGNPDFLFSFSGLAGGKSRVDGFVPPILDLQDPEGHFKKVESQIVALNRRIESGETPDIREDMRRRREMSEELQDWLFRNYIVNNALGERKSILDIFAARGLTPPGGTGECAAPKLLQYAYLHSLRPLAMGEFWYGKSPADEVRTPGCFYPSCTGKCGPLLAFMLQGLDVEPNPLEEECAGQEKILYEDDFIIVADKPSGMLSVPGKTMRPSLQERLSEKTGGAVYSCHRLDMDTSGLMVFARTPECQARLQSQFSKREVKKTYLARLTPGPDIGEKGRIILPISQDYYDRPRQSVDFENGKQAVTDWELVRNLPDGCSDVRFTPLTGRTHQLRVHSAHPSGLGRPILGDRLYGGGEGRLCLHAGSLEFTHPVTGKKMSWTSEADF
ncbi:MAG: pseudouridine synthase [Bacteroidales bacterium]|nr:pseudouridine synthase [Bacteroidales bacterium]